MEDINEAKKSKRNEEPVDKVSLTELRKLLKQGVVRFKYEKKDGSIRKANGTLKKSLIPESDKDKGGESDFPKECFGYYDIDRDDWRMFLRDNFIGVIKKKNGK